MPNIDGQGTSMSKLTVKHIYISVVVHSFFIVIFTFTHCIIFLPLFNLWVSVTRLVCLKLYLHNETPELNLISIDIKKNSIISNPPIFLSEDKSYKWIVFSSDINTVCCPVGRGNNVPWAFHLKTRQNIIY